MALSVEIPARSGRKPELWIGTVDPDELIRVADFGSRDDARIFCKFFERLLKMDDFWGHVTEEKGHE